MRVFEKLFWVASAVGLLVTAFFEPQVANLAFLQFLLPILGTLGSGLIGNLSNMSAQERAAILEEKGMQEWFKLQIPDPEQMKLAMERFVQVGELAPEMEEQFKVAETEYGKIQSDPKYKESRMRALSSLEEMGYGGEGVADEAAREQAIIDSGAANRGRQEAVLGSMARRGQLGTGLELSARMDASQAEGDRLASNALSLESDRRKRAFDSIIGAGNLAGDMESDEFNRNAEVAKAKDAINMFNTTNMQNVAARNVDRTNVARERNLAEKQRISDQNVGTANYEQQYNKELLQQDFDNRAKKAAGVSGQYGDAASSERAAGKSAADMWGKVASGAGQLGVAAMSRNTGSTSNPLKPTSGADWNTEDEDYWGSLA